MGLRGGGTADGTGGDGLVQVRVHLVVGFVVVRQWNGKLRGDGEKEQSSS